MDQNLKKGPVRVFSPVGETVVFDKSVTQCGNGGFKMKDDEIAYYPGGWKPSGYWPDFP